MGPLTDARRAELQARIELLRAAADAYHTSVINLGALAFTEFTGLMNEMTRIYERSLREGIDFTQVTLTSAEPLVALPHNLSYIQDKLEAIFAPFAEVRVRMKADTTPLTKQV